VGEGKVHVNRGGGKGSAGNVEMTKSNVSRKQQFYFIKLYIIAKMREKKSPVNSNARNT